jgi:hypothetical protein
MEMPQRENNSGRRIGAGGKGGGHASFMRALA